MRLYAAAALAALPLCACAEPAPPSRPASPPRVAATAAPAPPAPARSAPAAPDAGGASAAPELRIYSKVRFLWIRPEPGSEAWIGYLSLGDSVRVAGSGPAASKIGTSPESRCRAWYAVEPRGYVCTGADATTDPDDPVVTELRRTAADAESPWPYRYGESLGTPVYQSIPGEAEQRRAEWDLEAHLERVRAAADAQGPTGLPPPALPVLDPRARTRQIRIALGSTLAFTREFDHGGRSWLLTWDRAVVPRDRVRPYPRSSFRGVMLGNEHRLPLAFFRQRPRPQYRRAADGSFATTGASWPAKGWEGLTGEEIVAGERRFLATAQAGLYCDAADATVARQAERVPEQVRARREGRRTWLDVSIEGGWLVAYEDAKPVFATLVSPGRGGMPERGVPAIETASTPVGEYSINGKFLTATMVSSTVQTLVHAEVQYTQNFTGPHALHGAYWHDDWGEKKSGGCVNLSPIDAKWLFAWTEPALPPGWHAVRGTHNFGTPTLVSLHR
ncbi:MAG: L,D-transpeptidase [Deltaproteobacteria bacterium]|nr:L,D-transpeptidase [Deltaproteobacteria bacterium]